MPDNNVELSACQSPFELGKSVTVRQGDGQTVVIAFGSVLTEAVKAADILAAQGINIDVINARFAKPVDEKIIALFHDKKCVITVEDHSLACGFGSAVLEAAAKKALDNNAQGGPVNMPKIVNLGGQDEFIKAGSRSTQLDEIGVTAERIVEIVKKVIIP